MGWLILGMVGCCDDWLAMDTGYGNFLIPSFGSYLYLGHEPSSTLTPPPPHRPSPKLPSISSSPLRKRRIPHPLTLPHTQPPSLPPFSQPKTHPQLTYPPLPPAHPPTQVTHSPQNPQQLLTNPSDQHHHQQQHGQFQYQDHQQQQQQQQQQQYPPQFTPQPLQKSGTSNLETYVPTPSTTPGPQHQYQDQGLYPVVDGEEKAQYVVSPSVTPAPYLQQQQQQQGQYVEMYSSAPQVAVQPQGTGMSAVSAVSAVSAGPQQQQQQQQQTGGETRYEFQG
ncbi:hypothetical protein DFH27DRAFT_367763 [Peziza echinospora]|nr:hypothetical protein DFH27DRAFT_367763 [Peziza echinospora]